MKKQNYLIQRLMTLLFWIAFIGACILIGTIIIAYLVAIIGHKDHLQLMDNDFTPLLQYSQIAMLLFILLLLTYWTMVAIVIYNIILLFSLLKLSDPFHEQLSVRLIKIARMSLWSACLAFGLYVFCLILKNKNIVLDKDPYDYQSTLFIAGVMYLIALIFQKGEALQSENELTV